MSSETSTSTFLQFCCYQKLVANWKEGSSYKNLEFILALNALESEFLSNHFYSFYLIKIESEKELNHLENHLGIGNFLQATFSLFSEELLLEGIFHASFLKHFLFYERDSSFIFHFLPKPLFCPSRLFSFQEVCS